MKAEDNEVSNKGNWGSSHFAFVALLFFFSGLSSLIYQVIWTRQLVFVFGSTSFASATVLSVFMGGLAIGSFVAGKYADRLRNPFLWYGLLEGFIGIWAILIPIFLIAAIPIYKIFWQMFHLDVLVFSLLRFAVMTVILLPPTACMGATLPLLSKFVTSSIEVVGNRVGLLYSINTLGAVIGAIAAGFLLIPQLGLNATTISAAILNVSLAVIAFLLQKAWFPGTSISTALAPMPAETIQQNDHASTFNAPASDKLPLATTGDANPDSATVRRDVPQKEKIPPLILWTMVAFGISGALAMVQEVAWTRSLLFIIGSTTYAFSIMLSTFLIGIFLGSFVMAKFTDKLKNPFLWFCAFQFALCAAGLLSLSLFNRLPYWNMTSNYYYLDNPDVGMLVRFLLSGCILFPITLCLGAMFPLVVRICTKDLEILGKSIGTLYSINTLGAIIGAFAAGFVIIPALGSELTLIWTSTCTGILAASLLIFFGPKNLVLRGLSAVFTAGLLLWSSSNPQIWDLHLITSSQRLRRSMAWTRASLPTFENWAKEQVASSKIVFYKDGMCSNVAVMQSGPLVSLATNGHMDASNRITDMGPQVILPCIPMLIKPHAKEIGEIGWGSGCTMGYCLLWPINKMVCAEIEKAVIETSRFFHKINLIPESDPRLRIEINDGRNYMLATDETFDVIISEPSNPWQAGVCNLYTQDYFQICHDRLKPGGLFSMWWQYNEVSTKNLGQVFSALKKVYKHVLVFFIVDGSLTAIASDDPIKIDFDVVGKSLKNPKIKSALSLYTGINCPEDLAARLLLSEESIEKIAQEYPPNTDDRNRIEFDVARTYEQKSFMFENAKWLLEKAGPLWNAFDWSKFDKRQKSIKLAEIAYRCLRQNLPTADLWADASNATEKNANAMEVKAIIEAETRGNFEKAIAIANESLKLFPQDSKGYGARAMIELRAGAPMAARRDFEQALKLDPQNNAYKFHLAQTYLPELKPWYQSSILTLPDIAPATTDARKAIEILNPLKCNPAFTAENPLALATLAAALIRDGNLSEGSELISAYATKHPVDSLAAQLLSEAMKKRGDNDRANTYDLQAKELAKDEAFKHAMESAKQYESGRREQAFKELKHALVYCPSANPPRKLLFEMARKDPDAEKLLKQFSTLSPEDAKAYRELQSLKEQK